MLEAVSEMQGGIPRLRPLLARQRMSSALLCAMLMTGCGSILPAAPSARTLTADVLSNQPVLLPYGVAIGDVTHHSAVLWFRTNRPASLLVEWGPGSESEAFGGASNRIRVKTSQDQDFTVSLPLAGLRPATRYQFRIVPEATEQGAPTNDKSKVLRGFLTTAPAPAVHQPVTFVWSGDLGGQNRCRQGTGGYPMLDRLAETTPAFAIFLGDTIYADDRCTAPPNAPGGDFVASSLEEFRAKHRYQREASALQRFLAAVPLVPIWDDHEVRNNFAGPHDSLMPAGRQAFLEYWPVTRTAENPFRLYRSIRWGADLELWILDTRQYRSLNSEPDGPDKTMLGAAQRDWLLDGLTRSSATWKLIVTSVPLAIPKPGNLVTPGIDSWALGADGTGFHSELKGIVSAIMGRHIPNVVWVAGDVHFPQVNAYDPDRDGTADFYEFVAGPLSAAPGRLMPLDESLHPTTLYTDTGFYSFGVVAIEGPELRLEIRDESGTVRFAKTFQAREDRKR
jgi:alkaline phosphatase D